MKKEIIIVIVIIILIIIGHIFTQSYTSNFYNDICNGLDEIKDNINNKEYSNLSSEIDDIQKKWNKKFNVLAIFVEHDELEKIKTHLTAIKADIDTNEYNKCIEEIEICKFVLEHTGDKDALKIVNIF